eukprot:gene16835-18533_t
MSVASQKFGALQPPDSARSSRNGVALPVIKVAHPSLRIGDPSTINVRGVSRQSNSRCSSINDNQIQQQLPPNVLRPITADQMPFANRLIKSPPRHNSLPPLGETAEVKFADDRTKPSMPIFGNPSDLNVNRTSRPGTTSTIETGRVSTDEIEKLLREKLKNNYLTVKTAFKTFDPEGKGIVDRESMAKIISNFLGVPVGLSQFNKLTTRLHLDHKKMISFEDFYTCFRPSQHESSEYPTWLELQRRAKETMTATQVFVQLKEKTKQRFMDMACMVPQMNPGGTKRILKPEFRNALNNLGFHMEDDEYEKLWSRFDSENIGAVSGDKILIKLGITLGDKTGISPRNGLSPTAGTLPPAPRASPVPDDEQDGLDMQRWMTDKFREGARELMHAFYEMDLEKKGTVNKAQLKRVLADYNIQLDDKQIIELLQRCDLSITGPIDYKHFIKRFRIEVKGGMANKILSDPAHKFNQETKEAIFSDPNAAESKLMDLFQTEFLSLLGSFHKIDRANTMKLLPSQFRAVIESKFKFEVSDAAFKNLMKSVPVDDHGMVKYVEFMSRFDSREAKSLFDVKSTVAAPRDLKDFDDEMPLPASPRGERNASRAASRDSYDSQEGRSVEELRPIIKNLLMKNYQAIQNEFQELDEFNSGRFTPDMLMKLLKKFDLYLSRNEMKRLWDTVITDQKGHLEFMQFVRHFGYSLKSAAFPNAKISPPKRGDSDFQLRSKKLNSAYDMLEDNLRSRIDQNWEEIHKYFHEIDPQRTGFATNDQFRSVFQKLCIQLTDYECDVLSKKFDILKDGRISWIEFLKPFSSRRQIYRKGNNMMNILAHQTNPQVVHGQGPQNGKGLVPISSKLIEKFPSDTKRLQRAFRKLDGSNVGSVTVQEFTLVLKLCDVQLAEEETFQLLSELDKGMTGRVRYVEFLNKLKALSF